MNSKKNQKGAAWAYMVIIIALLAVIGGGIFWYIASDKTSDTEKSQKEDEKETSSSTEAEAIPGNGMKFTFASLETLDKGHFEAWASFSDDQRVSLGKFRVQSDGTMTDLSGKEIAGNILTFSFEEGKKESMEKVFVTIEPDDDPAEDPSSVVFLSGNASGTKASLSFVSVRLNNASGKYILGTPTNDPEALETSGVWFVIPGAVTIRPSLILPEAPDGWKYEGWVLHQGAFLTTGRFSRARGIDEFSGYSGGASAGPNFPGEDFLRNTPEGLSFSFPVNLTDGESKIFLTIEPDISGVDPTGDGQFMLRPFFADIAKDAKDHEPFNLTKDLSSFPTSVVEWL